MLLLAVAALVMPAIFELSRAAGCPRRGAERVDYGSTVEQLSLAVAIVLILTYVAGLVFSLRTHRDLFNPPERRGARAPSRGRVRRSVAGAGDRRRGWSA